MSEAAVTDPGPLVRPKPLLAARPPRWSLLRRAIARLIRLVAWAFATSRGFIDPSILPSPAGIAKGFKALWFEQDLPHHVLASLARAAAGGLIGVGIGLLFGLVAGLSRLGEELFDALFQMLRTIPFLALVPLFIVWFGIGEAPKLLLIALATSFPMYLNAYSGVRSVDPKVIEAMRSFGLKGIPLVRAVVLPLALPSILTGLRFSLGVAVLVLIAAEQINTSLGLGYLLNAAEAYQQVDVLLICIAIYAALGLGADLFVRVLERLLMPWRPNIAV